MVQNGLFQPVQGLDAGLDREGPAGEKVGSLLFQQGLNRLFGGQRKTGGKRMGRRYCFEAVLEAVPERGGAYVRFPCDLRQEFGRGRVRVRADFDGVSYRGGLVYMGMFREDGTPCPILGVRKDIRERLGKQPGDTVTVTLEALEE